MNKVSVWVVSAILIICFGSTVVFGEDKIINNPQYPHKIWKINFSVINLAGISAGKNF